MSGQDFRHDVEPTVREIEPDYQAWEGIDEAPKSVLVEVFRYLGRRTIFEVSIIGSLAGLAYLGGKIIDGGGTGLPPPEGYRSLLAIALLIFVTPAFLHYYRASEGRSDGTAKQQSQDPPESRDQRPSPGSP
jgi:hypothetical protein